MLNFKDAEWCKQNLAETLHEQQTESEPESNEENLEPPKKKMARSNEVTKRTRKEKRGKRENKKKNKGCRMLSMTEGKTSLTLEPQPEIQPEDRTTDIESDDTEDEDEEVIEATPSPCEARVEPALANVTPLRKRLPVSTAINSKLDQILENQNILFSMVRSLVREKNDSGFFAGEFGQRAIQILDKGNAEILNQGRDVFSDLGGTQMLDQGRVLPTVELGTVSPNVELGRVSPTVELGGYHQL